MGFGEPILFQLMEITFAGAQFLYNVWKTEVTAFFLFRRKYSKIGLMLLFLHPFCSLFYSISTFARQ